MSNQQSGTSATIISFPDNLVLSDRKALEAIDRFIVTPPDNSRVFWITPLMAKYLRERYNIDNRPEKPKKIGIYAASMAAGEWRLTGDTIKFSDRGLLRDGQNRLRAGEESDAPFQTHVVFGVPDDFFSAMDQGKNRGGSDLLTIYDPTIGSPSVVNAGIRWAHLLATGTVKLRTTIPAPEILNLYKQQYHDVVRFVPIGRATYKQHKWPAGFIAGALFHLAKIDEHAALDFGNAMTNASFSGRYTPLHHMNARLAGIAAVSSGRVNDVVRAALLLITWNLIRDKRKGTTKDLMWDDSKPFPVAK